MTESSPGQARYVFRVTFRIEPSSPGVSVDPETFDTTLARRADPPGADGWRFFRDNLWRGEVADERHLRGLAADALGVPVTAVSFSELRTDEAYLDALREEVGENLEAFNASSVDGALSRYLGSSIHVVPAGD